MSNPPDNPSAPAPIPPVGWRAPAIESVSPAARRFSVETMNAWIAEDEADFVWLRSEAGDP